MKILFLDIDGVVNNRLTPQTDGWPIDPYMAFLVGRLVERTDASVVLSSSWRHSPEGIAIVEKKVCKLFGTTTLEESSSRGAEIKIWLNEHPEFTKYAILDDDSDMEPEQKPNFFQTTFLDGLTEEIAKAVEKHLNS